MLPAVIAAAGCNVILGLDETQRRDAAGVDAETDAPKQDRDRDGVADEQDNCPDIANDDQHDEDRDGRGDRCDNCPHKENPDQADVLEVNSGKTADGVGDECDPYPSLESDRLVFFDGFNKGTTDWLEQRGIWAYEGDRLVQSDLDARDAVYYVKDLRLATVSTQARFEVLDIDPVAGEANPSRSAGVVFRFANDNGYVCRYGFDPKSGGGEVHQLRLMRRVGASDVPMPRPIGTLSKGMKIEVQTTFRVSKGFLICVVESTGLDGAIQGQDPALLPYGSVGLYVHGIVAAFDYLAVYDRGGPGGGQTDPD